MPNKQLSVFANIVLPIITVVVTIGLFLLFMPEHPGKVFWCNLVYTILIEGLLCGWFSFLGARKETFSAAFSIAMGTWTVSYALFGIIWMIAFSWWIPFRIYIALPVALALLWVLTATLVALVDNKNKEEQDRIQNK